MLSYVQLFVTPWTTATRLLCPWDSPGKETGVGGHALLWGIFPTQGWNPRLLHWQVGSFLVSHQGSPLWKHAEIKRNKVWIHWTPKVMRLRERSLTRRSMYCMLLFIRNSRAGKTNQWGKGIGPGAVVRPNSQASPEAAVPPAPPSRPSLTE